MESKVIESEQGLESTSESPINVDMELLKTLSQIGYMACMKGLPGEGEIIMESMVGIKPQTTPILLGLAFAKITLMKFQDAEKLICEEVLTQEPNNMTAKCFLGISLFGLGEREQANTCFADVLKFGNDDQKAIAEAYCSVEP